MALGQQFPRQPNGWLVPLPLGAWLLVVLIATGCAPTPRIYMMHPAELEAVRSEVSTIGVYLSPEPAQTDIRLPAKGVWGGLKRGIVYGAAMPVMLGFASPVIGGTYIGLLASPFGAIIGGIYGVSTAVPAEEVENTESMLEIATVNLRQMGLRETFVNSVIDLGNARTTIQFVTWPESPAILSEEGITTQPDPRVGSIDARLEISVKRTGLRGIYSINPPMDTFIGIHVQLISDRDNVILIDEHFVCASDEERTFADWADHEGSDFIDEFRTCVPELAEKIIDDFFLVYPLEWNDGDPD